MPNFGENKKLSLAYWLVTHLKEIKKISLIIFIIIDAVIGIFALFLLARYIIVTPDYKSALNSLPKQVIDFAAYREKNKPQEINILDKQIIVYEGKTSSDFAAKIENPNVNWAISSFDYRFVYDGGQTDFANSFILPQEEKFVLVLNQNVKPPVKNLSLDISNVSWKRVLTKDLASHIQKNQFVISDLKYVSRQNIENLNISKVSFSIKNNTIYSFWSAGLQAILYQDDKIVGVNKILINRLISGEKRNIDMTWSEKLPLNVEAVIDSEINTLDNDNYISR